MQVRVKSLDINLIYDYDTAEIQYLEHRYLKYSGYVEVICKSKPLGYLEGFKQSHLVRDYEV